jgi:hypothetical protein
MKKTISMKLFVKEFEDSLSEHMKKRLLELEIRCVLTRKEENNILDIKHVEHTKYNCSPESAMDDCKKEYVYGQLIVLDNVLYFSKSSSESDQVMLSPVVESIYDSLKSDEIVSDLGVNIKRIDDSNIDYVIDRMLEVFPPVSQEYRDIMSKYLPKK